VLPPQPRFSRPVLPERRAVPRHLRVCPVGSLPAKRLVRRWSSRDERFGHVRRIPRCRAPAALVSYGFRVIGCPGVGAGRGPRGLRGLRGADLAGWSPSWLPFGIRIIGSELDKKGESDPGERDQPIADSHSPATAKWRQTGPKPNPSAFAGPSVSRIASIRVSRRVNVYPPYPIVTTHQEKRVAVQNRGDGLGCGQGNARS
jgi:hypothetical protein